MKFVWDNGEWYQGEKPKPKSFKEWLKEGGYVYITIGLIALAFWWWFIGEKWLLGGVSDIYTPHKHLW